MGFEKHAVGRVLIRTKIRRALWNCVSFFLFRPFVTKFFRVWRVALLKIFGAKLAWDAEVYSSVKIWAPWKLQMGHRACLGPNVICYNQDWVILEDDAVVSQYAYLCTASHEVDKLNTANDSLITAPIRIRNKAWIGTKAFIGLGVCIGTAAVVGATASVYKNVDDYHVVGGNPAKTLKIRNLK
ncbi:LbetaH domain-containing protein [Bacteroides ndongoniae]|uniref:hypothetical protein n=1 Tax=Bacteroides ndongoniae TaxID=1903262 RepID=UPI0008D9D6B4|nr:hypothetical protein [Bacteroides ndongoniae]